MKKKPEISPPIFPDSPEDEQSLYAALEDTLKGRIDELAGKVERLVRISGSKNAKVLKGRRALAKDVAITLNVLKKECKEGMNKKLNGGEKRFSEHYQRLLELEQRVSRIPESLGQTSLTLEP